MGRAQHGCEACSFEAGAAACPAVQAWRHPAAPHRSVAAAPLSRRAPRRRLPRLRLAVRHRHPHAAYCVRALRRYATLVWSAASHGPWRWANGTGGAAARELEPAAAVAGACQRTLVRPHACAFTLGQAGLGCAVPPRQRVCLARRARSDAPGWEASLLGGAGGAARWDRVRHGMVLHAVWHSHAYGTACMRYGSESR